MDYFFYEKDSNNYIHSIDNLILTYYINGLGKSCILRILSLIQCLKDKYDNLNYWEKLNINPSSKFQFYQNAIHLDDGIYILIGHYNDYDRDKKEMYVFPLVKLEVNPNKHGNKPVLNDLLELLKSSAYTFTLNRYDYAIDIPVPTEDIQVFSTNKEKGLYKGTRYYGQRNRNGFCRIYDKAKESNLDTPLTRVEHIISNVKTTKKISFEKIHIRSSNTEVDKLSKTDSCIVELCSLLSANGVDYINVLEKLDYRKRKTIESHLNGCNYKLLEFNNEIHQKLLDKVNAYFKVNEPKDEPIEFDKNFIGVPVNAEGFVEFDDNIELPFD